VIWIRRWLKSGAPIVDMSSAEVLTYLERLDRKGRFAVFQLPDRGSFVQVIRNGSGGLELDVSRRVDAVERILGQIGQVSTNDLGFVAVKSDAGNDMACAGAIAQAIATLATASGTENVVRVRTGAQDWP
jgi:hypothetical protein